jgi:S1-C subfamily serine protease
MRPTDMRGPDIGLWFNRSTRDGLVISDVSTRGPIARLGFREGDRIVSVDGHRIAAEADFINFLLSSNADRVAVIVTRDGRDETIYVEPATLIDDTSYTVVDPIEQFGIVLDDRYDNRIVVWRVIPRSPAYYAGLREGDEISSLSGRPYISRRDFEASVRDLQPGEANLQVRRGDRNRDLTVDVPEYQGGVGNAELGVGGGGSDRNDQMNRDQSSRDQRNMDQGNRQNNNDRNNNPPQVKQSPPNPNNNEVHENGFGGHWREGR